MILLRRLTAILLTLVAALFSSTAAGGAAPHVAPHFGTYAYDNHHHSAGLVDIPTEPGPLSSSYRDGTAYDAVDGWAHGASADRDAIAPSSATTYNDLATLVHVESAGPTTRGPTQVTDGRSFVCDRTSVAAESDGGLLARMRANAGEDIGAIGPGVGDLRFARKVNLPADSPAVINRGLTVSDYIAQFRNASIRGQIPGEFLDQTVESALRSGNSTVRKLLTDGRWSK